MNREHILTYYESQGYLNNETLFGTLYEQVKKNPNNIAVIDKEHRLSYQELFDKVKDCAALLAELGLESGQRIILQLPNSAEFMIVLFASNMLNLEPILMLPTLRESEIIAIANQLHPKVYIGSSNYLGFNYCQMVADNLVSMSSITTIIGDADENYDNVKYININRKRSIVDINTKLHKSHNGRNVGVYLLSGGTTSNPKIIPKINEAYVYNIKKAAERCQIDEATIYLAVLSIAHDYALANPGVLGVLFNGGTVVLSHTNGFDESFKLIEQERVNTTSIVPAIASVWLENYNWFPAELYSLKHIIIGAAKIDYDTLLKIENELNVTVQQGYGLGEGITCFTRLNDSVEIRLGTQGQPISEADEIKILNKDGLVQPNYKVGEIAEKGPYTFLGYYNNESLNKKIFLEDNYFLTGDLGYLDDNGNLILSGRVDEQINRKGENIIPSEIESILKRHPLINNCAVFGMSDQNLGEKVCACIEAEGRQITHQEILNHFESQGIARYKVPDEIYFLEKLPYVNIGKIDKKKIIQMVRGCL
ncbi:TPA: AMP-binding protein [Staphylococcus aureus]|nr:AMP-binding protein [Staphylococcus aureus]HDJ2900556.1 AMP-binding protein [Staphylococcus aureus]HDJ2903109.1 AMP-binding protein [Staphylococcus aureus]HDJ2939914.1 AMP-binding protein [Staphylococcus aureus]HDJ3109412.1 AMP-binding protein [Staphylococcus aureus]